MQLNVQLEKQRVGRRWCIYSSAGAAGGHRWSTQRQDSHPPGGGGAFPSNCRDCETMDFFLWFSFLPFPPPRRCGIVHEEQEAPLTSKSPLTNWPPSQKWVWLCRIQQKSRALINHWARHLSPERVEGGGWRVGGWP